MGKDKLLNEELERHMQLLEYTFYMEEKPGDDVEDLLFDAQNQLNEQDPLPAEEEGGDEGGDDPFAEEGGEETGDPFAEEGEEETATDPFADEGGMEIEDEVADEGEDTVEVDVTDIVDKAEETRGEIDALTSKMDELLGKFGELEGQISSMDQVIDKIDGLEKEIEERNPTPVEKLEMRSMDSFPYSVSLTDFWKDQEGYDVGGEKEEEYVITQKDVDDFSQTEIQQSFNSNASVTESNQMRKLMNLPLLKEERVPTDSVVDILDGKTAIFQPIKDTTRLRAGRDEWNVFSQHAEKLDPQYENLLDVFVSRKISGEITEIMLLPNQRVTFDLKNTQHGGEAGLVNELAFIGYECGEPEFTLVFEIPSFPAIPEFLHNKEILVKATCPSLHKFLEMHYPCEGGIDFVKNTEIDVIDNVVPPSFA